MQNINTKWFSQSVIRVMQEVINVCAIVVNVLFSHILLVINEFRKLVVSDQHSDSHIGYKYICTLQYITRFK